MFFDEPGDVGAPGNGKGISHSVEEDLAFLRKDKKDDNNPEEEDTPEEDNEESDDSGESDDADDADEEPEESDDEPEEADDNDEEEDDDAESDDSEESKETAGITTVKDIKKDFPDFFKKHPEVRGIIYRERQYSELFAEPKDAQEALSKADTFDTIHQDVMGGDISKILHTVNKAKPEAFKKIISSLLPTIQKLDESTYMKLVAVPLKRALRAAYTKGIKSKDVNLERAAQHIHQYIFDDLEMNEKAEFEGVKEEEKSETEKRYEAKLNELDQRDHNNFKNTVDSDWLGGVQSSFLEKLDPNNTLTDWAKNKMFEDAVKELNKQMTADPRHMRNMEHLWKQAKASGYNAESKTRIVNAALARAKQILPEVRAKLRAEAFNKGKKVVVNKDGKKKLIVNHTGERKTSVNNKGKNPKSTSQMSELEALRS